MELMFESQQSPTNNMSLLIPSRLRQLSTMVCWCCLSFKRSYGKVNTPLFRLCPLETKLWDVSFSVVNVIPPGSELLALEGQ